MELNSPRVKFVMVVCGVKNHYLPKARIIKRVDSLFFLWLSCLPLNNNNNKTWCLTSSETVGFIRDGERGEKREIIYRSLHCHHQNDSCIKVGSDESHFDRP